MQSRYSISAQPILADRSHPRHPRSILQSSFDRLPAVTSPNRMRSMPTLRQNGNLRPVFVGIAIALGILAVVYFGIYCVRLAGSDPRSYKIDYNVFYAAWQSVLHSGGNPYAEQISPAT